MHQQTALSEQLSCCYGDPMVQQVRTKLRLKQLPLFVGEEATIYVNFRFYTGSGFPVSCFGVSGVPNDGTGKSRAQSIAGPQAPPEIALFHNGEPLGPLWATTRIGEFKGRFWAVSGPNEVSVELKGRRIFGEAFTALPGFLPAANLKVDGPTATALHGGAIVTLQEPWRRGIGRTRIRIPHGSAVGYNAGGHQILVPIEGDVEIVGNGNKITISHINGDIIRILDGINGKDASICIRMKKDRQCVLLE